VRPLFARLKRLSKIAAARLLPLRFIEKWRDARRRLARLEAAMHELAGLRAANLETARELVRVTARLNALAPRAELAATRLALERKIDSVRLAQEEDNVQGGAQRSYVKRELERSIRQAEAHRARVEATIDILLARLAVVERGQGVVPAESGHGGAPGVADAVRSGNGHEPASLAAGSSATNHRQADDEDGA
jgi:hypothetical protein